MDNTDFVYDIDPKSFIKKSEKSVVLKIDYYEELKRKADFVDKMISTSANEIYKEFEELKAKADKLDKLKLALISEHDLIIKKINKDGWNRYSEKMAYKDGLTFALDLINV